MDSELAQDGPTDAEKRIAKRVEKGKKLAQSGKLQQAATIFRTILKSEPREPDALHFLGIVLYQLGKYDSAMAAVRKSLAVNPDNPHALNSLGNFLKVQDDFDEAGKTYQSALAIDPLNAECLNNLGIVQRNQGKTDAAKATFRQATEVDASLAEAHYNLANLHFDAGEYYEALTAYRDCFKLGGDWRDPVFFAKVMVATGNEDEAIKMLVDFLKHHPDHEGARFHLAAIRGDAVESASETYVASHFNQFAESFDGVLKGLKYRAPELVAQNVIERLGEPKGDKIILDLGCGTGLCGPLIADYKQRLVGIDLSAEMLKRAVKLGCYDRLETAELQQYLRDQAPGSVDVIVCADTLVYLGALEKTVAGVSTTLKPGGIFVASVEKIDGTDKDYTLGIAGRFQHGSAYIERMATEHGLELASLREEVLRREAGEDVHGFVFEYRKPE